MLILDENCHSIILDSVMTPLITNYFWILDLEIKDFTLTPLLILEEIIAPTVTLRILGFEFKLPANWTMLVYSEETMQVDVVDIGKLAGNDFTSLICGPRMSTVKPGHVIVTDYTPEFVNYAPSLSKHQMLCHPIGPDEWVNVAPSDVFNKYLKNNVVGDILY